MQIVLPGIPFILKSGTVTSFVMLFGAFDLGGSGKRDAAEGGIASKLLGVSGKTGYLLLNCNKKKHTI